MAFFWMTGRFPMEDIDHINGNRDDNRWENLREASRSENLENINPKPNQSGMLGVTRTRCGNWTARIMKMGSSIILGRFTAQMMQAPLILKPSRSFTSFSQSRERLPATSGAIKMQNQMHQFDIDSMKESFFGWKDHSSEGFTYRPLPQRKHPEPAPKAPGPPPVQHGTRQEKAQARADMVAKMAETMTCREAAQELKVSQSSLWDMAKRHGFAFVSATAANTSKARRRGP
nr:HNH endonuclease signature motif containing protein [Pseudomonas asiatica]